MSSISQMRWYFKNRREEGVLCHSSDGEALKHFDQMFLVLQLNQEMLD